jgi:hypothetical protein
VSARLGWPLVAAVLAVRFLRTGGPAMLRMMNAPDGGMEGMNHGEPAS